MASEVRGQPLGERRPGGPQTLIHFIHVILLFFSFILRISVWGSCFGSASTRLPPPSPPPSPSHSHLSHSYRSLLPALLVCVVAGQRVCADGRRGLRVTLLVALRDHPCTPSARLLPVLAALLGASTGISQADGARISWRVLAGSWGMLLLRFAMKVCSSCVLEVALPLQI